MTWSHPILATYRHGENRVTASMVAVFERLEPWITERLLGVLAGETTIELAIYSLQYPVKGAVPDASIRGSFHYLIETKTERGALESAHVQLERHLSSLREKHDQERLLVLTPDRTEPAVIEQIRRSNKPQGGKLSWNNFYELHAAMQAILDGTDFVSDQSRFLLTELQALFVNDGLVYSDDVVIVAARVAYGDYHAYSAYVCQADRGFRQVTHFGFYTDGAIQPEIPRIIDQKPSVFLTAANATALEADHHPEIAEVIRIMIRNQDARVGATYQVFALSGPNDSETLVMKSPIKNNAVDHSGHPTAWVQGQRYTERRLLELSPATTADLLIAGDH